MRVAINKITQAMNKVRKFAEGEKTVPGVMLDIDGASMKVCYSNGKRSVIEVVEIEQDETPVSGRIILPYAKTMTIIDALQPSGSIQTGDLTIEFGGEKNMSFIAEKFIITGESAESVEHKVVSKFNQQVVYAKPEESIQYQVLSRMNYADIFESDSFDVWAKEDLVSTLKSCSFEKGKTIYVSTQTKSAFVMNTAHLTNIPVVDCEKNGMTLSSSFSSAIADVISKFDSEKIMVAVKDGRYANISAENGTAGVWFEMVAANKMEVAMYQRFTEKQYDTYRTAFLRQALLDAISCTLKASSNEKTVLTFDDSGEGLTLKLTAFESGAGNAANEYKVVAETFTDKDGTISNSKVSVSLKTLSDMVSNCSTDYVAFDMQVDNQAVYVRVGDILEVLDDNSLRLGTTHYSMMAA